MSVLGDFAARLTAQLFQSKASRAIYACSHPRPPLLVFTFHPHPPTTSERAPAMAQPAPVDVNSIPIIPEIDEKRRRTLVLCFDGTGDQFDADVSSIANALPAALIDSRPTRIPMSSSSSRCCRRTTASSRWFTTRHAHNLVSLKYFRYSYLHRLALGPTPVRKSPHHCTQRSRKRSTPPSRGT